MNDLSELSTRNAREIEAQLSLLGSLRQALPAAEIFADFRVGRSTDHLADIAIPRARFAIEIKRTNNPNTLRQAEYQKARLASLGWAGLLVFANEVGPGAPEIVERVSAALSAQS